MTQNEAVLPRRLVAPEPGWISTADVIVVGSGIAGLTTALRLAGAPTANGTPAKVMVVTKDIIAAGSTRWAQGGIAAALGADDSPEDHLVDTLVAGVGACDVNAVQVLVDEGPAAVRELVELGTRFDRTAGGELSLTREGGHHRDRIAHAGGDATGAEIERALVARVLAEPSIEVIEHAIVLDLVSDDAGTIVGVTLHVMGEGQRDGVGAVLARAVVVATGGIGQVYASTTNPSVSTGDGVAAAMRAGAVVRDVEFVQFHPTVLWLGHRAHGQQPLVSEAVRGEGAFLVDDAGDRFMQGQHEMADLAPRDVVAKAILRRMNETGAEHVWLDARHFGREKWRVRFPTILASLESHGIDPVRELIPVVPACHYASGGVRTDLHGRSSIPGLYVCGEAACTGVHGANRLASNSLLEGLVFGRRIAADIRAWLAVEAFEPSTPVRFDGHRSLIDEAVRDELQVLMSTDAGVLRDAAGLARAATGLTELASRPATEPGIGAWEATNLVTVAAALVKAAGLREETRGSHWREDFPDRDDEHWLGHLDSVLDETGRLQTTFVPASIALADALRVAR
ncbi:MAG: L-aspartate oxidase [Pseudonocardiales bacterium]|nr:L-aspartate oxidase [Pseudonocardiales bacterium]